MSEREQSNDRRDIIECGLKRQIIRYRNSSEIWEREFSILGNEMCKLAVAGVIGSEQVWSVVSRLVLWKENVSSGDVGIFSKIDDYTNKKGETFKAHFSENGRFLERCKTECDKPKSYTGNFKITPERFVFKMNADAKKLEDLFVGRYVNVDDDDELPLSLCAVAKRILKRGNKVSKQASK